MLLALGLGVQFKFKQALAVRKLFVDGLLYNVLQRDVGIDILYFSHSYIDICNLLLSQISLVNWGELLELVFFGKTRVVRLFIFMV